MVKKEVPVSLWRFPLQHGLGFGYAKHYDITDIRPTFGNIIHVLDVFSEGSQSFPVEEVNEKKCFFPSRVFAKPNKRGRGAWKLLFNESKVIDGLWSGFTNKNTVEIRDWTKIKYWRAYNLLDIEDRVGAFHSDYENIRGSIVGIVYDKEDIRDIATMYKIISDGGDVRDCYDLKWRRYQLVFIELINTAFPKEKTDELLAIIPDEIVYPPSEDE